jgi:signal transduction histidine kinase
MTRCFLALLAALLVSAPGLLDAAPSVVPLTGYRIRSWSGGEGVRLGNVRQIVQDRDGYLWLASSAGLVRFDGMRFSTSAIVEGDDLPSVQSRTVALARDGSLWVGYGGGRGVYQIRNGAVVATYLQNQIRGFVNAIAEDRSGAVWIAHDEGLDVVRAGRIERLALPFPTRDHRVFEIHESRGGQVWIAAATGLYRRAANDTFERAVDIAGTSFNVGIGEDAAGHLWLTDFVHGFRTADAAPDQAVAGRGVNVFFDHNDNLWVATFGQGLWRVQGGDRPGAMTIARATVDAGLLSDELSGFLEDRDGNLWVGANVGLHRLTPNKATSIVDVGVVHGVATDGTGTTWLGGTAGLVALRMPRGGNQQRRLVTTQEVRALHRAGDGVIWAATTTGLHQLRDGRLEAVALSGPHTSHVIDMASDRHGTLWVCDEVEGLVSIAAGRAVRATLETADATGMPSVVMVDSQDRLWIAFSDGTMHMVHNGIIDRFGPGEGLAHTTIFAIHDGGNGEVWVGGDHGLSRFVDGHFQTLSGRNLPNERVLQIIDDEEGRLWLGLSTVGFIRISPSEIIRALADRAYRLHYAVYTSADGIAGAPDTFNVRGVSADNRGRLWFVTGRGVTMFDSRSLKQDPNVDSVHPRVEGVIAEGRWYQARQGIRLPAGVTTVRIDYARVNLSSFDQISLRYRLDGVDREWVDGTGRRQASYTNLKPGNYRLRLQSTSTGAWDEPETTWHFAIAPTFYQTGWFLAACLLSSGLAIVALWQLRLRQIRKELAVVYNERVRLSREIHDTLLQSLAGVAMQLDVASSDPGTSTRMRIAMVRMRRQLEDKIEETRESIWNLRSATAGERDIVTALRNVGQRITSGRVRFAMHVTGTPRRCESKVQAEALRIAQEAVMNAVRHGHAQQVQLDLGFSDRTLRLSVSDDGRGFDPAAIPSGNGRHYGIVGMQERAAEIGGRCTIDSVPGKGSQVTAEFPLSA